MPCSRSSSKTRLSSRAQLSRTGRGCAQFVSQAAGCVASAPSSGPCGTTCARNLALGASTAQNVVTGTVVTLNGSGSTDANNDPLTYSWTLASKPAGSAAALAGATTAAPTFSADLAGTYYVASLVVNDGQVNSAAATVTITATVASTSYDGTWSGTTSNGRTFSFSVGTDAIPSTSAGYTQCAGTATITTTFGSPIQIVGGSFSYSALGGLGIRGFTGSFSSTTQDSGTLVIRHEDFALFPACLLTINLTWTATKQ